MAERRKPTPEEVNLGGIIFTRIDNGGDWTTYRMNGPKEFVLQAPKTHGQINGEWDTNKGIGYFLGIVNKFIADTPDEVDSASFMVDIRSTKTEQEPVPAFDGHIYIPFHSYNFAPPLTLDDLAEAGHYSYDEASPVTLKFLRVDVPTMDCTYSIFNPERPQIGAVTTLDMDNWKNNIELLADLINGTFAEPGFDKAGEILLGIIGREYPNALSTS